MNTEPVYKLEPDKIRQNLIELEPIEDVYIRRYWFPARLQVIVKERIPLLTLYADENSPAVAFFTQDGVLIGSEYLPLPPSIQTLKVLAVGNYREWDNTKILTIQKIADYIEQLTSEKVEYVDIRNTSDVYVKINNLKLRIGGLDSGIYDRLSRLASIKQQLKTFNKPVQYVDLRWRNSVYIKTQ